MIKYYFITFFILSFIYLNREDIFSNNSPADRISNKLIARSGTRLSKQYGLSICTTGGGGDRKGLRLLSIGFDHRGRPYTKDEARKLIVTLTEEFLKDINDDLDLRPHLLSFPFTPSNVELTVIFLNENGEINYDPYLESVSLFNNKVGYYTMSPEEKYQYKTKIYESYDEALAIVNNEIDEKDSAPLNIEEL